VNKEGMTRKYVNDRWCVRCGKTDPTPYLRDNIKLLLNKRDPESLKAVDIGCGNGRCSIFLKQKGVKDVTSVDMAGDFGTQAVLGEDPLPVADASADIILANYILMFLDNKEVDCVVQEIERIAKPGCFLMLELYPAKDSHLDTNEKSRAFQKELFDRLGWKKHRYSQERFIVQRE
jgi:SAM-dependent methyltransferase